MNKAAKTIGATVGSATLLGAAMMAAAPMPFVSNEDYGLEEASLETTSAVTESIKEVRGAFAFDQTTTVATASIVEVFNKAAATLCSAMPQYAMDAQGRPVCVKSPNTSFTATVDELSDEDFVADGDDRGFHGAYQFSAAFFSSSARQISRT